MRGFLAFLLALFAALNTALSQGIPEPGLVLYGAITNTAAGFPLNSGSVVWNISGGASSATVTSAVVSVNSQFFYVAELPFETRVVPGQSPFPAGPNTLELTTNATSYSRSATADGTNAAITFASSGTNGSFTFSTASRGSQERVNLSAPFPNRAATFAEFASRFFGTTAIDPNADADGDGRSNYAEFLTGTDPTDSLSGLRINVVPAPGGGVTILWSSVSNKTYTLERSLGAPTNYAVLQSNIVATPPTNSYTDPTVANGTSAFYRLTAP